MQGVLRQREQVATASGLDVLAGIWLLISPFVLGFNQYNLTDATTNNVIVGLCVAVLAAIRAFGAYRQSWISWINAVLGLWTLVTPWVLGFSTYRTPTINNVVIGVIIIVLACWSALAGYQVTPVRTGESDVDRVEPPPL
jgi:hypothetical protein